MIGGIVTNGVYRPRLTNVAAKQIRLSERMYDGNEMTVEVVPMEIQPIARPSSVILGCNVYGQAAIEVLFGSDGLNIRLTDYDDIVNVQYPVAYTISAGSLIKITRVLDVIVIHVNGVYAHSARHPLFRPDDSQVYVGFSTTSSATGISSALGSIKFTGSTYQSDQFLARVDVERRSVSTSETTMVTTLYSAQGGHGLLMLNDFRWTTNTSFSQREGNVFVNGVREFRVTSQNGGSASKEMTIPPNTLVELRTWVTNAGANDRIIGGGVLEIYPY